MTRQVLTFMTMEDERVFSEILKSKFPEIVFLDDNVWSAPYPVMAPSIDQCKSSYGAVYLWNKTLFPNISISPRSGGGFQGPGSGPVAQFLRSKTDGRILLSGRVAVGFHDEEITAVITGYVNAIWRLVK